MAEAEEGTTINVDEQAEVNAALGVVVDDNDEGDDVEVPAEFIGKGDDKRFRKLYARMKKAEHKIRKTEEEKSDLAKLVEEMKSHNAAIRQVMEKAATKEEVAEVNKTESEIDSRLRELKAARNEARSSMEWDKVDELEEQMEFLKGEKARITRAKATKPAPAAPSYDVKAVEKFIGEFKWADHESEEFDPTLYGATVEWEKRLVNDPKMQNKSTYEILVEAAKKATSRFKQPTLPGGVDNSTVSGKGKQVTLSADEMKMASAFGMTPQEWAKQKLLMGRK